jgi:hypothetical protein
MLVLRLAADRSSSSGCSGYAVQIGKRLLKSLNFEAMR